MLIFLESELVFHISSELTFFFYCSELITELVGCLGSTAFQTGDISCLTGHCGSCWVMFKWSAHNHLVTLTYRDSAQWSIH